MSRKIELLAPGGDIDSIKAAIAAGADAVYCGLNKFNARNRAENITFDDLNGILRLAHKNACEVFLTLNISIVEPEIPDLIRLLNKLVNTSIDGVIIQDLGLFYILSNYFKGLKIHASTQLTTHNQGQLKFLSKLNARRVNLSRELNCSEIKSLTTAAHQNNILTEVFVHGSYCISYSGICYISSVHGGNSGNRGRCSQPCRDEYETTPKGNKFPLNLKDNSAWFDLQELSDAGVDSLKIEGRIKKFHYVYSVVDAYRKQLSNIFNETAESKNNSILYKVYNRDFSNAFLSGDRNKNMFIDNPRDNSATHLAKEYGEVSLENIDKAELALYAEKGEIRTYVKGLTNKMSSDKARVIITVSGKAGKPLQVAIKTPDSSFVLFSETNLGIKGKMPLDKKMLLKRFKAINETEYFIEEMNLENLEEKLFISFKELTAIKNEILFRLRNSKEMHAPVEVPALQNGPHETLNPRLAVLINSETDVELCEQSSAVFYFRLPSDFTNKKARLIELFTNYKKLIPWFPSVLIGENYRVALEFLQQVQPKQIVTNNTGIAIEADILGISWVAGPFLNTTNSYALKCLKENFNCTGAFISNELSRHQIRFIRKPQDFELYYSIYHPILLMSSRQCFFYTTVGCKKTVMDEDCIPSCKKRTTLTNLKKETFFIEKSEGNYNSIYNDNNFLNTKIIRDVPNRFSVFMIDLSNIKTNTKMVVSKLQLIALFENYLQENQGAVEQLQQTVFSGTCSQYKKGI